MATVTTRIRPFDLGEAQRRVRGPLDRLAGYIRGYVALEGVALFCTFLAVWFWITLLIDFGFFKVFGLDWVQSASRLWRALALGTFFSGVVAVLQFPTLLPAVAREVRQGLHEAFAVTPRQYVPFWVRLTMGVLGIAMVGVLAWLFGGGTVSAGLYAGFILASLFVIGLVSLLYLQTGPGFTKTAAELPPLLWARAGLGVAGLILGCILGGMAATGSFGETILAATAGAAIGAVLFGSVAWLLGSLLYLVVTAKHYRLLGGVPALAAYLTIWALVGVAADGGALGPGATGLVIALLLLGPAVFLAAKRLFHDFADRALALVLERRFPQILGDRLITAVELRDPQATVQYGYSPAMIEETIHEAAQRVDKLPLKEVFDWRRLVRQGVVVLIVTIGCYVAAGAAFMLGDKISGGDAGLGSFSRFHDVAAIWGERNLLLENTIWPRRAHLEFVGLFADVDEYKVGRDNATPTVRVRALKWVIADRDAPEGWRAMYWGDVTSELLGEDRPDIAVPAEWAVRDPERGPSLDEIEIRLGKQETHATSDAATVAALRDVLGKLEEQAAQPKMSRRFRMLTIPSEVFVNYKGTNTRSEMTLKPINDNEYEGQFPELKENVDFYARGEDYYTANRKIIVVPPPGLARMTRDQYEPAYLYYRGKAEELRGKKQVRRNVPVSLYGGDVLRIELPAGSDVVLTAETDKELQPDGVKLLAVEDKKPLPGIVPQVTTNDEGLFKVIQTRFTNVRNEIKFYYEFTDTDNVMGRRQVTIRPQEDLPPEVGPAVGDAIRKTAGGYMVTPLVQIPFAGDVRDDHGLESIEFVYVLTRTEPGELGGRPLLMASAMQLLAGGFGQDMVTAACLASLAHEPKSEGDGKGRATLGAFNEKLVRRPGEILPMEEVLKRLDQDLTGPNAQRVLLKDFKFDAEDPELYFDFSPDLAAQRYPGRAKLPRSLKADEGKRQPRYRLQLWMEATDTDIDTGPHRAQSKERFTFLIVPEEELVTEVAKDEEKEHVKLDEVVRRLREGEAKLTTMKLDLASQNGVKKDQFGNMSLRTEEVEQTLEKTLTTVNEVYFNYQRILQELLLNRVQTPGYIKNIEDNIVAKLRESIDGDYPATDRAVKEMHKILDADQADLKKKTTDARAANDEALAQLAKLIKRLDDVLASMEKLTNVNKLIAMLLVIQQELGDQELQYQKIRRDVEEKLFEGIEAPTKNKKKPEIKRQK